MIPLNSSYIKIPEITRESVQELSDRYVGSAITRSLVQSIDYDIEHRRRLLECGRGGYLSDEEVSEINNEIQYLIKLAISLY